MFCPRRPPGLGEKKLLVEDEGVTRENSKQELGNLVNEREAEEVGDGDSRSFCNCFAEDIGGLTEDLERVSWARSRLRSTSSLITRPISKSSFETFNRFIGMSGLLFSSPGFSIILRYQG
jgi:hypothetical protein